MKNISDKIRLNVDLALLLGPFHYSYYKMRNIIHDRVRHPLNATINGAVRNVVIRSIRRP